jgi:hypothetical protein
MMPEAGVEWERRKRLEHEPASDILCLGEQTTPASYCAGLSTAANSGSRSG